jgi:SEC-C motif-containing protein
MMPGFVEKRVQAKIEGEVLKWGKCLCAQCGKKGKMGTTTRPTPQKPVVRVLCKDCASEDIAQRHNISRKEAEDRLEKTQKAQERLLKIILERYKDSGKKLPKSMEEISKVVQPGIEWWQNGLSENERWEIAQLSKDDQKQRFRESPILPAPKTPIVNTGPEVGRNDPCPCGSGKKYKKCCLEKAA